MQNTIKVSKGTPNDGLKVKKTQLCRVDTFFSELFLNVLNPLFRKGKIPSITRESNPAPLELHSATTTTSFRPLLDTLDTFYILINEVFY
jgi:hypothetical protein